ncbi:hypothetical protein [Wolbachia endosymbiont (group B) of Episyrphus balteatus]|uniref:hypothetical protein n=1 Tax=Wolbachia endosymbiont (group B) of Episyrphus balteatus TaxID=2954009 RepID=UPI0022277305|nr:hypothetical protein [Wolbachia endosymbiont (group B) of Episyrphus balteatus]
METKKHSTYKKMGIDCLVAAASLAGAITAILIATKVIAGPASLALIASPAGIAALFIAAVYFAAAACASYQQMQKNEEIGVNGTNGKDGKDADFSVLLGDAIKKGEIVEESQKLNLKLSKDDYEALTNGKNVGDEVTLNVLLKNKSVEVKFKHVNVANDNYKVQLTSVDDENQLAEMKEKLVMDADSKTVAVSSKDMNALKADVTTKLGEVAVNAFLSKIANSKQL